ncbi:hypothetical protein PR048_012741 [Dryococelus australis]|uniref:Uncharacterized protein n=1 Tax=Dryococelus australis TaxID=614101 RepID=A0ABQ9HQ80_9NEOP|nr:hypothetical protein PR048_012741 [Dryococelus australis]
MAHSILRGLLSEIRNRKALSIIVDETRDETYKEQVSIYIRTIKSQILDAEELFVGLYETPNITGEICLLCSLSFKDLRGQYYDGGSKMSGALKGLQAIITEKQPKAQYHHGANHTLNLALQDCVKNISLLRDRVQWVQETHYPKPLWPTRWTVRVKSITSVINSYPVILQFLHSLAESNEDVASKARGLYDQFSKGEVYLGLRICLELFSKTNVLKTMTLAGASEAINVVLKCLREKRNEDGFNHLWSEMDSKVVENELIFPTLPRSKNTPKRLQQSNYAVPDYQFASPEELYRDMHTDTKFSFSGAGKMYFSSGHTCHICISRMFFLYA